MREGAAAQWRRGAMAKGEGCRAPDFATTFAEATVVKEGFGWKCRAQKNNTKKLSEPLCLCDLVAKLNATKAQRH